MPKTDPLAAAIAEHAEAARGKLDELLAAAEDATTANRAATLIELQRTAARLDKLCKKLMPAEK